MPIGARLLEGESMSDLYPAFCVNRETADKIDKRYMDKGMTVGAKAAPLTVSFSHRSSASPLY